MARRSLGLLVAAQLLFAACRPPPPHLPGPLIRSQKRVEPQGQQQQPGAQDRQAPR